MNILTEKEKFTPLMMAINYGNLEIFKFFLDSKASLNDQDIY